MEGRDVAKEFVKNQVALAYKWLLEHRATSKYQLRVSEDEKHFSIAFPPFDGSEQLITPEDLADLVVEDQIGGSTPWEG